MLSILGTKAYVSSPGYVEAYLTEMALLHAQHHLLSNCNQVLHLFSFDSHSSKSPSHFPLLEKFPIFWVQLRGRAISHCPGQYCKFLCSQANLAGRVPAPDQIRCTFSCKQCTGGRGSPLLRWNLEQWDQAPEDSSSSIQRSVPAGST